jgi:acyl-CoA reductase-like NAD-dependent aldehyde dehydrogenase
MNTNTLEFQEAQDTRNAAFKRADLAGGFFNIIDGQRVSPGGKLDVADPATGKKIATVPDIDRAGLDTAVASARAAFPAWSAIPYAERQAMVVEFVDRIRLHRDELLALLTAEHGRPLAAGAWELEMLTDHFVPTFLQLELKEEESDSKDLGHVIKRYVPLGTVCAISPWNVPILLSYVKVFGALLTGNTVVLKPSPYTPLTVLRIADLGRDVFPPGAFNVVTGGDDLGPWMTSHPGFDKVTFTGSTVTGKRVMESAAPTLKRLTLELGGNDPAIVLPDADLAQVVPALFWSMFALNGHACISVKRLFVPEQIYPQFTKAFAAYAATVKTGDGFAADSALGPIQNKPQFDRIKATWEEIRQSGAKVLYQGQAPNQGFFFPVTILDNPPDEASFVAKEVFGPIRSILKYRDVDQAIRRANDTTYGLGASVWGKDPEQLRAVARRLDAGTVWINQHLNLNGEFPFSGHKQSGFGAEFGIEGMRSYCNVQVIAAK